MPEALHNVIIAMCAIQSVIVVVVACLLIWYRNTRLLKASQYPMLWLVLSSGIFGAARIGFAATNPDDGGGAYCVADYWMGHMAFFGVIALFVKTVRVHILVNAAGMRRMKISTAQVLYASFGLFAILVIYMAASTGVSMPTFTSKITESITGQLTVYHYCYTPNVELDYFLYIFEGLILVLAAKFCYDTKDVPDAINETKVIAIGKRDI
jgi:hypothetical protein